MGGSSSPESDDRLKVGEAGGEGVLSDIAAKDGV